MNNNDLDDLLVLFYYGYKTFTSEPDRILEKYKIQRTHHRILFFINKFPGISVNKLLKLLDISKQALQTPLKQLIDMNLVESSKSEKDQRIKELRLTSSGTKLTNELTKVQNKKMNAIFNSLGDEYKNNWKTVMKKLASDIDGYSIWEKNTYKH